MSAVQYTPEFRQRFREAFVAATSPTLVRLLFRDGQEDSTGYACVPPYPAFGDCDPDNAQGGAYVLTWKFILPIGVGYGPEHRILGYRVYAGDVPVLDVTLDQPYLKSPELPGVIFLNLAL